MSPHRSNDEPASPAPGDGGLVRVRLDLAYDGTDFAGWARQPGLRTVQGSLEEALATVLRLPEPPRTTCAGRTDAGVHARAQVAHVDLPSEVWATAANEAVNRLNGVLPEDVRVHGAAIAPDGFDARFGPLSRTYRYRICDDPHSLDPLHRHEVLVSKRRLDVAPMNQAAHALLGEHDFAAFCRRREGASTVRALLRFSFSRTDDGLVVATIEADAFCHSMVRALIGALMAVGEGRRSADWPAEVLAGRQRIPDVHVAAPHGLTLEGVRYPDDAELAVRAEAIRAAGIRSVPDPS